MENILDQLEPEDSDINENNLLITIWHKPSATLRFILENCPEKYVLGLLLISSIVSSMGNAAVNDDTPLPFIGMLFLAMIFGGTIGLALVLIFAWLMSVSGRILGGKANPLEFRTILAWSSVPQIATVVLILPTLIIYGEGISSFEIFGTYMVDGFFLVMVGLIQLVLWIWSIVILVKGIMIIQNFGVGLALVNLILPAILSFIVLVTLVFGLFFLIFQPGSQF